MGTRRRTNAVDWEHLYRVYRPDPDELRKSGAEFAHPEVHLGRAYGDAYEKYWDRTVSIEFQVSLRPQDDGHTTNDGLAYAGTLEVKLEQVATVGPEVNRILKKAQEVAPHIGDQMGQFISGMRILGYREALLSDKGSVVVTVR